MRTPYRIFICSIFTLATVVATAQQSNTPNQATQTQVRPESAPAPTVAELQEQMRQMRAELQAQIDALKHELALRNGPTGTLLNSSATQGDITKQTDQSSNPLTTSVSEIKANQAVTAIAVQQIQKKVADEESANDHPAALHYKGVTLVPGGFVAGESVWRQRAMNADIYTNWNSTPFMNNGEAYVSEWVPTARQSRLSLLGSGTVPFGKISGYFEGDFLSAGVTSNNLQSNSYTLRVRQAWAQAATQHTVFTAGQMWTLLTENKKGASPGQEAFPLFFDANLHVGYSYARQLAFRLQQTITPSLTVAVALENSQYQFSASNAPSNFFFGSAGAAGGLNNSTANYTDQVAPDMLIKVSFDPKYGHYELGGIVRLFRDRYYPSTTATSAMNDTVVGGGLVANARVPITPKADVGLHVLAGDGTGRYGASLLPDITVHPSGTLEPLRNVQALLSVEGHLTHKLDVFGYAGTEYVQRTYYTSGAGTLVGYAPPNLSDVGCNTEAPPTGNTGYLPGSSTCGSPTRNLVQGTAGWVYRAYSGSAGRLQYGFAYSYLVRNGWAGVGGAPRASNNLFYTSFRYYLP